MAKAAVKMQRTGNAAQSLGNITAPASSMRRVKIVKAIFGSEGTVNDNPFLFIMQRCTTTGTRTTITPRLIDPSDAALVATAGENHSAEPTYTASEVMDYIPLNQRATFTWWPSPGGEIIIPATANNGIGVQTPTAAAVAITGSFHIDEQ